MLPALPTQERLLDPQTAVCYEAYLSALDELVCAEGNDWPYAQQGLFQYVAVRANVESASTRYGSTSGTLLQTGANAWRRWCTWRGVHVLPRATTADLEKAEIVWIVRPSSFAMYKTIAQIARQLPHSGVLLFDSSLPESHALADVGRWGNTALHLADKFHLATPVTLREAGQRSGLLIGILNKLFPGPPAQPPAALSGLVWRNCLEAVLAERFVQQDILPYCRPRLVVSALDVETEAATVHLLTQAVGATGVVLQHGSAMDLLFPSIASQGLLWGQQSYHLACSYETTGRASTYQLTGAPRTDENYEVRKRTTSKERPPQVLFVSQFSQHQAFPTAVNQAVAEMLIELANRLVAQDTEVAFRPRSAACLDAFQAFSRNDVAVGAKMYRDSPESRIANQEVRGTVRFLSAEEPLRAQLAQADLVIGIDSTALLEAMQAGIPVIQLWGPEGEPRMNYYQDGSLLLARCAAEVERYFQCALNSPAWRQERVAAQDRRLRPMFANPGRATQQTIHWFQQQLSL